MIRISCKFIKSVQNYKKKSIYANAEPEIINKPYKKKEGLSSRQPNLLLNLKSNTMKNTVQRYCFFVYPPNILYKNMFYNMYLVFFVKSTWQKAVKKGIN